MASVYSLLSKLPGASYITECHLTHLKNLLETASKGHYGRDMAITLRNKGLYRLCDTGKINGTKAHHPFD